MTSLVVFLTKRSFHESLPESTSTKYTLRESCNMMLSKFRITLYRSSFLPTDSNGLHPLKITKLMSMHFHKEPLLFI